MVEQIGAISDSGWVVIGIIAFLLFIVLMTRGLKIGSGEKSIFVGKAMDKRIEGLKKDIEHKGFLQLHDEELQKELLQKTIEIDKHLIADMRKSVRRIDKNVQEMLRRFDGLSPITISLITTIIKDELNERIDYNKVQERLTKNEIQEYLYDIVKDIRDRYSTLYLQMQQSATPCPTWQEVQQDINTIITQWSDKTVQILAAHIKQKIEIYTAEKNNFKFELYKDKVVIKPIEKNTKYLKQLGVNEWNC